MPDIFSDFIIYADESGSPVMHDPDPDYPIFVLVFLLIRKSVYTAALVPTLQRLKFDFVGHDQIIFHERDIRRQSGAFSFLQVARALRDAFLERLNELVRSTEMILICTVIDKVRLRKKYSDPWSPYDLALLFCMERVLREMRKYEQVNRKLHFVFESRGAKEDRHLELQFRRIAAGERQLGLVQRPFPPVQWEPVFADKRSNSAGLQVADLIARPAGLKMLRPDQPNRAYDAFATKLLFPGIKRFPQ